MQTQKLVDAWTFVQEFNMDSIMRPVAIEFVFISAQIIYGGIGQLRLACQCVLMALLVKITLIRAFKGAQLDHMQTVFFIPVSWTALLQEISMQILQQIDVCLYAQ